MRMMVAQIQNEVARQFKIDPDEMTGRSRHRVIVRPRQIAMYMARTVAGRSVSQIGRLFGGRHYSTVIEAIHRVEKERETDPRFHRRLLVLERDLKAMGG